MRTTVGGVILELESIAQYLEVAIAALDFMEADRKELPPALAVIIDRNALAPLRQQDEVTSFSHIRGGGLDLVQLEVPPTNEPDQERPPWETIHRRRWERCVLTKGSLGIMWMRSSARA